MTEVNKEAIAEWVAALRSRSYKQGRQSLHQNQDGRHMYCCLGVACDLFADRLGLTVSSWSSSTFAGLEHINYDGSGVYLPTRVAAYLGIDVKPNVHFRRFGSNQTQCSLTHLNDIAKMPFDQIADLIEATYLKEDT